MSRAVEEWKTIPEAPTYQVSTLGCIRRVGKGLITPWESHHRYLKVSLRHEGRTLKRYVHRLVAQAFIEGQPLKPEVNHINGNPSDNEVKNLEWVDSRGNKIHARDTLGAIHGKPAKSVTVRLAATGDIYSFRSRAEASRQLGISRQNLLSVIAGRRKSVQGYVLGSDND